MKIRLLSMVLGLVCVSNVSVAQNFALDVSGGTELTAAAGAAVDGATELTLGGWIYPRDAFGGFPNFDGFFGFRDNSFFDFYILQLNGTDMEIRFRNSIGTNYDIVSSSVQLNQWQHVAMTYDGSTLSFYYNGVLESSIPASGAISAAGDNFYIGVLPFGFSNFNLDGQTDNVQMWRRALSAEEIVELHCQENISATDYPDLVMHYTLNDGSGATTADDVIGGYTATITGAASWPSSGATNCDSTACSSAMAPLNPDHLDGPTATLLSWDAVPGSQACRIQASRIVPPGGNPSVNIFGFEVSSFEVPFVAVGGGSTWVWAVRCACTVSPLDATPLSTTDTFSIPLAKTAEIKVATIYPNPASDQLVITGAQAFKLKAVVDLMGREVLPVNIAESSKMVLDISSLQNGMYFLQFENGVETFQVRRE